ncbi:hypothetical protein A9R05_33860 (plasmid) [Burkholderia sp. KK1]|nr:hypothetical protein A9R05_33860 [Burkholderia sp. KK1]
MTRLAVLASGMVTALGFNAPATLAALRAGVSGIEQTWLADTESGVPLRGAKARLPQWWDGVGKLANLLAPAIHECAAAAHPLPLREIPLLIGIAAPGRPARLAQLDEGLLDELHDRLRLARHPHTRVFAHDQAGCALALLHAQALIDEGVAQRVIVAGVDSFLSQPALDIYMQRRRVMTQMNSNGFFPGEAGCAVLVGGANGLSARALVIEGMAADTESATIDSTNPLTARALTRAIREALARAGLRMKDIGYRLTDLSGEHYKFKEAAFAYNRFKDDERSGPLALWHPIEYLGEIGAAILPCLLAQALHAASLRYAPGPVALCHIGSDAGERVAIVARMNGEPR